MSRSSTRDLAWFFQLKMGQNLDDGHFYYKVAWAMEMMNVFGGAQPNFDRLINPQTPNEKEHAKLLREKYKMDPARMRTLNERYGPLDWRLPEAHAIYWSSLGMERAKGEDVRRLRQGIYQSMNLSFQRGKLVLSTNGSANANVSVRLLPNLDIAPRVDTAYQEQLAEAPAFLTNNMSKAYRSFLRDVPYQFFIVNRVREGEQWLRYLRQKFPEAVETNTTLAEYAIARATENVEGQSQVKIEGLLKGFVIRAYDSAIEHNADDYQAYMDRASELRAAYMKRTGQNQRTELTRLDELKDIVLKEMLSPNGGLSPEEILRLKTEIPRAAAACTDEFATAEVDRAASNPNMGWNGPGRVFACRL